MDRNKALALSFHTFKWMQTVKHNVTLFNSILRLPTALVSEAEVGGHNEVK